MTSLAAIRALIDAAAEQRRAACRRHDSEAVLDAIADGRRAANLLSHTNPIGGSDANSPRPTHCHTPSPTRQCHTAQRRASRREAAATTASPSSPSPSQAVAPPTRSRVLGVTARPSAPPPSRSEDFYDLKTQGGF